MSGPGMEHLGIQGFQFKTWGNTCSCEPELYFVPESVDQLRQILDGARRADKTVRVVGEGQSLTGLACTEDYLICMKKFNKILNMDQKNCTVKVESGAKIADLNETLAKNGLALSTQGINPHVSIGGAISTGTHGSGGKFGNLSSYVLEMELMCASGDVITVSRERDEETFLAAAVSLGVLGVILTVTMKCEEAFMLQQNRYPAKLDDVLETLDTHVNSSDHVAFAWIPHTGGVMALHSSRTKQTEKSGPGDSILALVVGYYLFEFLLWLSSFFTFLVPYINKAYYKLIFSSRVTRVDRSDKIFTVDILINQRVNEWAVPRSKAALVIKELQAWIQNNNYKAHLTTDIRFASGDELYLSPAHGRDTCFVNITAYRPYGKYIPHDEYWRAYERIMGDAGGRPHWAKPHNATADQISKMYPKWTEFCRVRQRLDPQARFLNKDLQKLFG